MPVWLRKFYYRKIEEAVKARQKAEEKANKRHPITNKIQKPNIRPAVTK
jgi:hypothetical protein